MTTREYPKDDHKNDHFKDAPHPAANPAAKPHEKTVSELHEEEIDKAKADIAALLEKARQVQYAKDTADKPDLHFVEELQAIFLQIHKLNAKWLVDRGYEYEAPPFSPATPAEPAPEASKK